MAVRFVSAAEADRLASSHIRLVWREAHRFARRYRTSKYARLTLVDELFAEGMVTLATCINAYRPSISKLSTFLVTSLRRKFHLVAGIKEMRSGEIEKKRIPSLRAVLDCDRVFSIDAMLDQQTEHTINNTLKAKPLYSFGRTMNEWMDALLAVKGMKPAYAAVLVLHYRYGYEFVQIGEMMNQCRQRVWQLHKLGLEMIQRSTVAANRIHEVMSTSW